MVYVVGVSDKRNRTGDGIPILQRVDVEIKNVEYNYWNVIVW